MRLELSQRNWPGQWPLAAGVVIVQRLLREHRQYLVDQVRLSAFARALEAVVRDGDIALDLGCGSGILGLLACRAGAARIYAVDSGEVVHVARAVARDNDVADRVVHIRGRSLDVTLPERADLAVCDQVGPLGFDAGLIEAYDDARRRLLKPNARLIPSAMTTWFAPSECPSIYSTLESWLESRSGFRFDAFHKHAVNTVHSAQDDEFALLAAGAPGLYFDLRAEGAAFQETQLMWSIERDGVLHGLAGWFVAELTPEISVTNAPGAADRIRRRMALLPMESAVAVSAGDQILAEIQTRPAGKVIRWRVMVSRGSEIIAVTDQNTLRGFALSSDDVVAAARRNADST